MLCEATVQVSNIDCTLMFYVAKCVYYCCWLLWLLWVTTQPATMYTKPLRCIFAPADHVISANLSYRWCAHHDKVISPTFVWATLFTSVQVTLPTHFGVNQTIMPNGAHTGTNDQVISTFIIDAIVDCATCDWVDLKIAVDVIVYCVTHDWVELKITVDTIVCYVTLDWVDPIIAVDEMAYNVTLDRVNSIIAVDAMAYNVILDRMDLIIAVDAMAYDVTLDRVDSINVICNRVDSEIAVNMITSCAISNRVDVTIVVDVMICYKTRNRVNLTAASEDVQANEYVINVKVEEYGHCFNGDLNDHLNMPVSQWIYDHCYTSMYSAYNEKKFTIIYDTLQFSCERFNIGI
jgi:hypothetical protein